MSFNRQILSLYLLVVADMDEKEVARLVGNHLWLDLKEAEEALIQGQEVSLEIAGNTPGQQLRNITAALWILEKIRQQRCDLHTAIKQYRDHIR